MSDPEPKIYAPLLLQLENNHPTLAKLLVGVGDAPVPYDAKKREVEARFKTEAGTEFSGKYHTEAYSADVDAKEFLSRMVKKADAANAADSGVLADLSPVAPPPPVVSGPEIAPVSEVSDEHDDPEPPPLSESGDDADWNKPVEPTE